MVTKQKMNGLPISTTNEIPGYQTSDYIGFVWGTSVQSKFLGHDILAAIKSLMGGEVWQYTKMVNDAKHYVIQRMVKNAKNLGADGVLGVRVGSAQIIPGTVEIFAYGTAVKLKKKKK